MRTRHLILLGLLGGLLLTIAWPGTGSLVFPVFFGFVPLLFVEDYLHAQGALYSSRRIFRILFPGLFLWNVGVCFFIFYIREPQSSPLQEFVARVVSTGLTYGLNTTFMTLAFWLFHATRKRLGDAAGYTSFIFYWLGFEYLHMHWSINWPWLNLGNVFADAPWLVQWYEFFGSPGGSLWVLLINLFFFHVIKDYLAKKKLVSFRKTLAFVFLIVLPILSSLIRFSTYEEQGRAVEVVCVQPNLDPYEEKFDGDPVEHLARMLELMDEVDSDSTQFYLFPETALQEHGPVRKNRDGTLDYYGLWEGNYERTKSVVMIQRFLSTRAGVVVAGAADRKLYDTKETPSGRYYQAIDMYYDSFNSTLLIDENGCQDWYRKSKLVPGTESIPFSEVLSFLEKWSLEIGGTSGSLGTQQGREPFEYKGMKVAANICYESVFGEFTSLFVRNGAQALFVSSNDAWWQSSPGHEQLMLYCKLRAIECRKNVARSANTGISCFVDQRGVITSQSKWLEETAIKGTVQLNDHQTFYVKHGDFISRVACLFSVLLMLWSLVRPLKDKYRT